MATMPDRNLTYALLPGFPRPETDGPHFQAELSYVQGHGQPRPILVDRAGVIWAGRTLANVCFELGLTPATQVVDDGYAAAVQELATRDLSVLEWADLVLAVHDDPSTKIVPGNPSKRSVAVSFWFKTVLAKERGFSPSQVEQYLRVARSAPAVRQGLRSAGTLAQAVRMLKANSDMAPADVADEEGPPTDAEEEAMTIAAAFMEALGQVQFLTKGAKDTLRGLRSEINAAIRRPGPSQA